MGQSVGKRSLITKPVSIYDTSVLARKYRHDFEALQLSEEKVRLMWDEFCKVSTGVPVVRHNLQRNTAGNRLVRSCGPTCLLCRTVPAC